MSLFVCDRCGCVENTALGDYWGCAEKVCSECSTGTWHGRFPKEKWDGKRNVKAKIEALAALNQEGSEG